ncbi:MAG TPA: sigma factor-like helix-turn-helix DNA-binding protein [Allosphingosinicella sp.]|jgi:RNA polymerase sigma-70 factor (ECF subfamily)
MTSDTHGLDHARRIEEAVANLPRIQREIFMAHTLDGMSFEEIAGRTGRSTTKVERHMAKALSKLTKQLRRGRKLSWWERWF